MNTDFKELIAAFVSVMVDPAILPVIDLGVTVGLQRVFGVFV